MRGGETRAKLARNLQAFVSRQPANAPEQRGQVFSIHVFHSEKNAAAGFTDIENPAYVGMGNLAGKADFGVEPLQRFFVLGKPYGQEFEGHGLAEFQVIGPVNLAHASLADERDDAVALCQLCSRNESLA
jgi:hypothetical protein